MQNENYEEDEEEECLEEDDGGVFEAECRREYRDEYLEWYFTKDL